VDANLGAEHLVTVLPVFRLHHEFITRFPARADSAITKDDVDPDGEISREKVRGREREREREKERERGGEGRQGRKIKREGEGEREERDLGEVFTTEFC